MTSKLKRIIGNVLRLDTLNTKNVTKLKQKRINTRAKKIEA